MWGFAVRAGRHGLPNGRGGGSGNNAASDDTANLFGAATERKAFKAAIHSTTHRIGRHMGFQAYCLSPETKVRSLAVQESSFRYVPVSPYPQACSNCFEPCAVLPAQCAPIAVVAE